jgi:hypothetical protein
MLPRVATRKASVELSEKLSQPRLQRTNFGGIHAWYSREGNGTRPLAENMAKSPLITNANLAL